MKGLQPTVVGKASFLAASNFVHGSSVRPRIGSNRPIKKRKICGLLIKKMDGTLEPAKNHVGTMGGAGGRGGRGRLRAGSLEFEPQSVGHQLFDSAASGIARPCASGG